MYAFLKFFSVYQNQREKKERKFDEYDYDSWEEDYGYSSSKRSCRQRSKVNYNFDEYEQIMNKAIKNSENEDPTILPGMVQPSFSNGVVLIASTLPLKQIPI